MRERIAKFLEFDPRNKVVFVPRLDSHLQTVDVGNVLAAAIEPHLSSPTLPQIAEEAIRKIMINARHHDPVIGPYVALRNWGILFEPSLEINLLSLFDQYDKNQTLILENCGVVANGRFHLANKYSNYGFPIGELKPYILNLD